VTRSPGIWHVASTSKSHPENHGTFDSDHISKELSDEATSSPRAVVSKSRELLSNSIASIPHVVHQSSLPMMQSTQSFSLSERTAVIRDAEAQWPRHLSFSIMDEVLGNKTDDRLEADPRENDKSNQIHLANEALITLNANHMNMQLRRMQEQETIWIKRSVRMIEELDQLASKDQDDLELINRQKMEEQGSLRGATADLVSEERLSLTEALKDIDVLGAKLEYELSALHSKIKDVEDSVTDFERQVLDLERRALDLTETEYGRDTWGSWIMKLFTGKM